MTKFEKSLLIINGIMFPSIFLFTLIKNVYESIDKEENSGLIVGEELNSAIDENKALQGIFFEELNGIYNSSNYYLPISVGTFEEAREISRGKISGNNFSYSESQIVNIVFLDKNLEVSRTLLDKKACITGIDIKYKYHEDDENVDTNYKYLAYLIAFSDNNNDGFLNSSDYQDLYISNLDGQELVQVTQDKDIESYEIDNQKNEILITYKDRKSKRKREHRLKQFCIYDIQTKQTKELVSLNKKLLELEQQVISK